MSASSRLCCTLTGCSRVATCFTSVTSRCYKLAIYGADDHGVVLTGTQQVQWLLLGGVVQEWGRNQALLHGDWLRLGPMLQGCHVLLHAWQATVKHNEAPHTGCNCWSPSAPHGMTGCLVRPTDPDAIKALRALLDPSMQVLA